MVASIFQFVHKQRASKLHGDKEPHLSNANSETVLPCQNQLVIKIPEV
jgi:hypothetical protein